MAAADVQGFIYAFFPFMFGIYPYTVVTEKQKEALRQSHTDYVLLSIYEITRDMAVKLLQGLEGRAPGSGGQGCAAEP